jgi:hypothetical protein
MGKRRSAAKSGGARVLIFAGGAAKLNGDSFLLYHLTEKFEARAARCVAAIALRRGA